METEFISFTASLQLLVLVAVDVVVVAFVLAGANGIE